MNKDSQTNETPETSVAPEGSSTSSWLGNTMARIGSAAVLVPIIVALLFWAPPWGFTTLSILAVTVAGSELMHMVLPKHRLLEAIGIVLCLAVFGVMFFAPEHLSAGVVLLPVAALLAGLAQPTPIETAAYRVGWLIAGPLFLGGMLVTVPLLHRVGGAWVLLAMGIAFGGDTGGYFAGRFLGRHKLYKLVSPKKTVEGALGGLLGSTVTAVSLAYFLLPSVPLFHVLALAIAGGLLGQAGDLCESLIKRSTGVKDSGSIIPGHGGLLDRVDALMFTSATTWAYVSHFIQH